MAKTSDERAGYLLNLCRTLCLEREAERATMEQENRRYIKQSYGAQQYGYAIRKKGLPNP